MAESFAQRPYDRSKRKGGVRGTSHPKSKLDWEKVRYIRTNPDGKTQKEMSEMFGVGISSIYNVQQHWSWRE